MLKQLIEYECPTCNAEYGAYPEKAGTSHNCGFCKTNFLIPAGIQPRLVSVGTDPGRPLTPEETAAFYGSYPQARALVPRRAMPSELVPEPYERMPDARYPVARQDDDKPVNLTFGKWGGLQVEVDGKTRSSVLSTIIGGVLVAVGAVIAARFGFRSRS